MVAGMIAAATVIFIVVLGYMDKRQVSRAVWTGTIVSFIVVLFALLIALALIG